MEQSLAGTLDEDTVIVEGHAEYATWRPHLAYLRDPYGDPDMEMEIDGVGGVSILAKAKVFRSGVHIPTFSFEKHAETEGFGSRWRKEGNSRLSDCLRESLHQDMTTKLFFFFSFMTQHLEISVKISINLQDSLFILADYKSINDTI